MDQPQRVDEPLTPEAKKKALLLSLLNKLSSASPFESAKIAAQISDIANRPEEGV
jgi:hypothetical protein